MIPIRWGPQVCGRLDAGAALEWLVTDGLGGYAMGTVSGLRTRRYHGLLTVAGPAAADGSAAAGPAVRRLAVAALDPVLVLESGARVRLGVHEWADGTVDPAGHALLEGFALEDGLPRWRWRVGGVVLERELAMVAGRPAVAVRHRLLAGAPVELVVDALVTWRDAHGERYAAGPEPAQRPTADGVVVAEAFRLAGPGWQATGQWWLGAHHREEAARGLAAQEDLWHAGRFAATLGGPGQELAVCAWAGDLDHPPPPAAEVIEAARRRTRSVVAAARPTDAAGATLAAAADAFVVRTPIGPDVVAGYPWFGAWSRDTMLSYEGLFLATGRADEGRELLRGYAATLSGGMLANTADTGRTEYNTVDATMWFLHAVRRHVDVTGDTDLAAQLCPTLAEIVRAHLAGTRYGIAVDPADSLLSWGVARPGAAAAAGPDAAGEALTWMDARVGGVPVTPRAGKPVEVNALWVSGLAGVAALHRRIGADPQPYEALAATARASFAARFPDPATGWLRDVVDGPAGDDPSLRPNQLLAWSLPDPALPPDPAALRRIAAALLTPLGLRTLAPGSPGYAATHRGGPAQRDGAYHQGTVWPWLLGPFADAARAVARTGGPAAPVAGAAGAAPGVAGAAAEVCADTAINELFFGIESHLREHGLGSVSETADAQAPHAATGCPFQAWSVAEVLRARRC
ncbi:MAG TPA: amylo-alpha-1,6-glucosidase [Pilimelia sp.]|nr:amylo-alpha-1,6-glucosidase [Pilimelia sp.]